MFTVEAFKNDHRIQLLEKAKLKKKSTLWPITSANKYFGDNFVIFYTEKKGFIFISLIFLKRPTE